MWWRQPELLLAFGGAQMGAAPSCSWCRAGDLYRRRARRQYEAGRDYATSAAEVIEALPAARIRVAVSSLQSSLVQVGVALAPMVAKVAEFLSGLARGQRALAQHAAVDRHCRRGARRARPNHQHGGPARPCHRRPHAGAAAATLTPWGAALTAVAIVVGSLVANFISAKIEAQRLGRVADEVTTKRQHAQGR